MSEQPESEYNRAMLTEMEANSIHQRSEAAMWLIQAGYTAESAATVVGLPDLVVSG